MSRRRWAAGFAACVMALSGCAAHTSDIELAMSLREGQTYRMRMVMDQHVEQTLMGTAINVDQTTETVQRFDVREVDSEGVARVTWVHESVRFSQDGPMGHVEYDSSDTTRAVSPMTAGYAAMVGRELSARIAPTGVVSDVQGMNEILDAMLSDVDSATAAGLRETLRAQLGNEAMANLLSSTFAIFPAEPVGIGDSWERTIELSVFFPLVVAATWTLRARRDGIAVLDVVSTVTSDPDAPPLQMGAFNMNIQLSGEQTGTIELDESTGWIVRSEITQELAGEASMSGTPELEEGWPMKITGTITTEAI